MTLPQRPIIYSMTSLKYLFNPIQELNFMYKICLVIKFREKNVKMLLHRDLKCLVYKKFICILIINLKAKILLNWSIQSNIQSFFK